MDETLTLPDGTVRIAEKAGNRRHVRVELNPGVLSPRLEITTTYPPDLIRFIGGIKGAAYLCDEIARHEDPAYVSGRLLKTLRAYVADSDFDGSEVLDFGCGGGASAWRTGSTSGSRSSTTAGSSHGSRRSARPR